MKSSKLHSEVRALSLRSEYCLPTYLPEQLLNIYAFVRPAGNSFSNRKGGENVVCLQRKTEINVLLRLGSFRILLLLGLLLSTAAFPPLPRTRPRSTLRIRNLSASASKKASLHPQRRPTGDLRSLPWGLKCTLTVSGSARCGYGCGYEQRTQCTKPREHTWAPSRPRPDTTTRAPLQSCPR